ncbi:hypothetical protein H0W26_00725 [Candidatus Dependentiae bacterium]|nr:hypothetical protein [Candidatus Dependentiae bacterium]
MNLHFVKSLTLCAVLLTTGSFAFSKTAKAPKKQPISKGQKAPAKQLFTLILKTIHNTTPYDILIVDRLANNKSVILPAGKTIDKVNLAVQSHNEVIIKGSMADVMSSKAQYVFKKLNSQGAPELNQEVYFNLHVGQGGVDNGSGFITGTPGSLVLNFYAAGKNGGCTIRSSKLDNNGLHKGEFDLELFINEEDVKSNTFRMKVGGELSYK